MSSKFIEINRGSISRIELFDCADETFVASFYEGEDNLEITEIETINNIMTIEISYLEEKDRNTRVMSLVNEFVVTSGNLKDSNSEYKYWLRFSVDTTKYSIYQRENN